MVKEKKNGLMDHTTKGSLHKVCSFLFIDYFRNEAGERQISMEGWFRVRRRVLK